MRLYAPRSSVAKPTTLSAMACTSDAPRPPGIGISPPPAVGCSAMASGPARFLCHSPLAPLAPGSAFGWSAAEPPVASGRWGRGGSFVSVRVQLRQDPKPRSREATARTAGAGRPNERKSFCRRAGKFPQVAARAQMPEHGPDAGRLVRDFHRRKLTPACHSVAAPAAGLLFLLVRYYPSSRARVFT
jgi:hypothetical protein